MESTSKNKNRAVFEDYPVPKAVMTLAVPTIIGQLTVLIYNLADTYFIGRTNNPLMVAGASLMLPVYNICVALSNLAGNGGSILVSRLLGRKEYERAGCVSSFSFWISAAMALFFSLFMAVFMVPVLRLLGASDAVLPYAKQYTLCVLVFGALPTILSMTLSQLLRSIGCSRQAGLGITLGGLVNIGLDPLFMFVLLPDGMQVLGAGLATMLSNTFVCLYYLIVLLRLKGSTVLRFSPRLVREGAKDMKQVFSCGFPSFVMNLCYDLFCMLMNRFMAGYGDIALAAFGITLKSERLPLNICIGLSQGMTPLAAYNYSAGNHERFDKVVKFTRNTGLIAGFACVALYMFATPYIVRFFIADAETVSLGTLYLRLRVAGTPLFFLSFMHVFVFQALAEGKKALCLVLLRWLVFDFPLLILSHYLFGVYGVLLTQAVGDGLTGLVSVIAYKRFIKKQTALSA